MGKDKTLRNKRTHRIAVPPLPAPPWHERWRAVIRTSETAIVVSLWAAGLAAGDMIIASILLLSALIVGAVAIAADPTRAKLHKVVLAAALFLGLGVSEGVAIWRHAAPKPETSMKEIDQEIERRLGQNPPTPSDFSCDLKLERSSRIVERLISEHPLDDSWLDSTHSMTANAKQLFYEFNLSATPSNVVHHVKIGISGIMDDDSLLFRPQGEQSEREPRWVSGFIEKTQPDFYSTYILFPFVSSHQPIQISARRLLQGLSIAASALLSVDPITLPGCTMNVSNPDPRSESEDLFHQANALSNQIMARSLPLVIEPLKDVPRTEVRATHEMWCEDRECGRMQVSRLAVHMGQSFHDLQIWRDIRNRIEEVHDSLAGLI